MKFRPCIDLHAGKVKQIVGSTLVENSSKSMTTNFVSEFPPSWFAELYRKDKLEGGHIIQLGANNTKAAKNAIAAWPNGMQIGGGITDNNAKQWLDIGASAVIVTSYVFQNGQINKGNLKKISQIVGKQKLVLDLSCRKKNGQYWIVTDQWQKFTETPINDQTLNFFAQYCFEFLIHAVDVEGKCLGVDIELLELLSNWQDRPITYAGGIRSWDDLDIIKTIGKGNIDFTVGSALDIFGGNYLQYKNLVEKFGITPENMG